MDPTCPTVIDAIVRIWRSLHSDLSLEMEPAERRYARGIVMGMEDDLVARLLAIKVSISGVVPRDGRSEQSALCGSDVLYDVQGRRRRARLVHGSNDHAGTIGVGTRFGAALFGLRSGQSILWPHDRGTLVDVRVLVVARGRPQPARSP